MVSNERPDKLLTSPSGSKENLVLGATNEPLTSLVNPDTLIPYFEPFCKPAFSISVPEFFLAPMYT